jgi:hypothetical protein
MTRAAFIALFPYTPIHDSAYNISYSFQFGYRNCIQVRYNYINPEGVHVVDFGYTNTYGYNTPATTGAVWEKWRTFKIPGHAWVEGYL